MKFFCTPLHIVRLVEEAEIADSVRNDKNTINRTLHRSVVNMRIDDLRRRLPFVACLWGTIFSTKLHDSLLAYVIEQNE